MANINTALGHEFVFYRSRYQYESIVTKFVAINCVQPHLLADFEPDRCRGGLSRKCEDIVDCAGLNGI